MIDKMYQEWSDSYSHLSKAWQEMTIEQAFRAGVRAQMAVEKKANNNFWTEEELDMFLSMARNGCSAPQIAAKLGRSKASIYGKARYFGVKITKPAGNDRRGAKITDSEVERAKFLRGKGWKCAEVAKLLNTSENYVTQITRGQRRAKSSSQNHPASTCV